MSKFRNILEAAAIVMAIMLIAMVTAQAQPAALDVRQSGSQPINLNDVKNHNTAWSCDKVNVTALPFRHDTILSQSISDLNKMTKMAVTLGLVAAQRTWTVGRQLPDGSYDDCDIQVGYINASLYIASELAENQCAFDHVMRHEQEHIAIYRRHLATLKERTEQRLPQAKTLGELHKALDFLTSSTRPDHAQLDSPAEYATNMTACRGDIKQIMFNYINNR